MRISEPPMVFDDYYHDDRFARKKAREETWKDRCGDNVYRKDATGRYEQAVAFQPYFLQKCIDQDLRHPRVFISDYFFYFGEKADFHPEKFTRLLRTGKWPQGCGAYHKGELVDEFVDWLEKKYPQEQYDRRQPIGLPAQP